jgi:hypothetical protein
VVACCCECCDEPLGSGATELVICSSETVLGRTHIFKYYHQDEHCAANDLVNLKCETDKTSITRVLKE